MFQSPPTSSNLFWSCLVQYVQVPPLPAPALPAPVADRRDVLGVGTHHSEAREGPVVLGAGSTCQHVLPGKITFFGGEMDNQVYIIRGFPWVSWVIGVPSVLIHCTNGIFHEINHPAMGVPHLWKPPYEYWWTTAVHCWRDSHVIFCGFCIYPLLIQHNSLENHCVHQAHGLWTIFAR